MINKNDAVYLELIALYRQNPDLFEEIDSRKQKKYENDRETLYRDGESDLIEIDGKIFRFSWEDVEEEED